MKRAIIVAVLAMVSLPVLAANKKKQAKGAVVDVQQKESAALTQAIDRVVRKEAENMKMFEDYNPLVETYAQTYNTDKDLGRVPLNDYYFLGRASFKGHLQESDFLDQASQASVTKRILDQIHAFSLTHKTGWVPTGFAQMSIIDANGFDRQHYDFSFERQEYLGEVRCFVFNVIPKAHEGHGRFMGRIWVEEEDYNIVRINGTYVDPKEHSSFVHFDSWRTNVAPGKWLPSYIYGEETTMKIDGKNVGFRAQTRLWGYEASGRKEDEFTSIFVDSKDAVDQSGRAGLNPVASERDWQRQAEDNVLDKMEKAGLLSPPSDLDNLLCTVVNNLEVTNNLNIDPEVRCRILLTAPIEAFTVGHTIVLSRGLLDVLPDEASLAAVLAEQLSHIALDHDIDTKFSFADRVLFADDAALSHLDMARSVDEQVAADKKTMEILQNSPYKDKLESAGLFMKALADAHSSLPNLQRGRLGNALIDPKYKLLAPVVAGAPALKKADIKQVAALPLGSRVVINPWDNKASMSKAPNVALQSAKEKMPFQLTPFVPYLYRVDSTPVSAAEAAPQAVAAQTADKH